MSISNITLPLRRFLGYIESTSGIKFLNKIVDFRTLGSNIVKVDMYFKKTFTDVSLYCKTEYVELNCKYRILQNIREACGHAKWFDIAYNHYRKSELPQCEYLNVVVTEGLLSYEFKLPKEDTKHFGELII